MTVELDRSPTARRNAAKARGAMLQKYARVSSCFKNIPRTSIPWVPYVPCTCGQSLVRPTRLQLGACSCGLCGQQCGQRSHGLYLQRQESSSATREEFCTCTLIRMRIDVMIDHPYQTSRNAGTASEDLRPVWLRVWLGAHYEILETNSVPRMPVVDATM